jgi:hypothetical protein
MEKAWASPLQERQQDPAECQQEPAKALLPEYYQQRNLAAAEELKG